MLSIRGISLVHACSSMHRYTYTHHYNHHRHHHHHCSATATNTATAMMDEHNNWNGVHQAHLFAVTTIQMVDHHHGSDGLIDMYLFQFWMLCRFWHFFISCNLNRSVRSPIRFAVRIGRTRRILSVTIGGQFWYHSLWIERFYGFVASNCAQNDDDGR